MNYDSIDIRKQALDSHRPLAIALVRNLDDWFRVELTYTSNAIEGNTLTRQETALVVEKGLTVGGKSLKEHLEAANHAHALDWVRTLVSENPKSISEHAIFNLHNLILKGIDDENAGRYRNVAVRISGSAVVMPNSRNVPDLMAAFVRWIHESTMHPVQFAAEAHYEFVTIHPFVDGNGRTARLLMNLILLMYGYPPAIIRTEDRLKYLNALEKAQLGGSKDDYLKLIGRAVDRSLGIYLKALAINDCEHEEASQHECAHKLLKIGELAKAAHETVTTIRFWTKEGLLDVAELAASGYQLYAPHMIDRVEKIKVLKAQRLTLAEIKVQLSV